MQVPFIATLLDENGDMLDLPSEENLEEIIYMQARSFDFSPDICRLFQISTDAPSDWQRVIPTDGSNPDSEIMDKGEMAQMRNEFSMSDEASNVIQNSS